jgi:hypothetical protein
MKKYVIKNLANTGTGFLRVLRFPLPILILPAAPRSSTVGFEGSKIIEITAGVQSGLKNLKKKIIW